MKRLIPIGMRSSGTIIQLAVEVGEQQHATPTFASHRVSSRRDQESLRACASPAGILIRSNTHFLPASPSVTLTCTVPPSR